MITTSFEYFKTQFWGRTDFSATRQCAALVGLVMLLPTNAETHEFWIQPKQARLATGERNVLDLRVGDDMKGNALPYLPHEFDRFTTTMQSATYNFKSTLGDRPAASYIAEEPGLHVIVYQSKPKDIAYKTLPDFQEFLDYEGLGDILEEHRKRELPQENFKEIYSRYAKTLVQVGPARRRDADVVFNLRYELVAMENPYSDGADKLRIAVLQAGKPVPHAPVAVFSKAGETVSRKLMQSDEKGEISVTLRPNTLYLVNAVSMEPLVSRAPGSPVWHSHWASLYFGS